LHITIIKNFDLNVTPKITSA